MLYHALTNEVTIYQIGIKTQTLRSIHNIGTHKSKKCNNYQGDKKGTQITPQSCIFRTMASDNLKLCSLEIVRWVHQK